MSDQNLGELLARLDRLIAAMERHRFDGGPDFLSIRDVAERLRVDPKTVRSLCDAREIPTVRVGRGNRRVRREDYEAFARRVEPW